MNVEIKLIIVQLDLPSGSSKILLDNNLLITRVLTDNNISRTLSDILLDYLEISPDWVKFNLIDTIPTNSHISIIYSCLIPSVIQNKKGEWVSPGDINDRDVKKLIFQSIQKIT